MPLVVTVVGISIVRTQTGIQIESFFNVVVPSQTALYSISAKYLNFLYLWCTLCDGIVICTAFIVIDMLLYESSLLINYNNMIIEKQ